MKFFFLEWMTMTLVTSLVPKNHMMNSCRLVEMDKVSGSKRLITLSPGGYKGFYTQGICVYLKEQYDLREYLFSGASAGSWNALFMTCKKDIALPSKYMLDSLSRLPNLFELQTRVKDNILSHYTTEDFELDKLFIGVTAWQNFQVKTFIYSQFCNLEDAIDCCFASSHIPFFSGSLCHKYKNMYSFDGGFSQNPYLDSIKSDFHISANVWTKPTRVHDSFSIENITTMFDGGKYDANKLLMDGYHDASLHKSLLDSIFSSK